MRAYLRDEACDRDRILNTATPDGDFPLSLACMFGHFEIVRTLVGFGADVDQPGAGDDWTPLVHAARTSRPELVRFLIDVGADRTRVNKFSSVWAGDHLLKHAQCGVGGEGSGIVADTMTTILNHKIPQSWTEVIDAHWSHVRASEEKNRDTNSFEVCPAPRPMRFLPPPKASTLVKTHEITLRDLHMPDPCAWIAPPPHIVYGCEQEPVLTLPPRKTTSVNANVSPAVRAKCRPPPDWASLRGPLNAVGLDSTPQVY